MAKENSSAETTPSEATETVQIRRAPRFFRFMVLGAIVGLILALIFWSVIPESQKTGQPIFGYLIVFITGLGFGLGALAAVLVDRVTTARSTTAEATKLEG